MVLFGVAVSNFASHTPDTLFMTRHDIVCFNLCYSEVCLFLLAINPCKAGIINFNNQLTPEQKQTLQCLMQIIPYLKWVPTFSGTLLHYIAIYFLI